MIPLFAIFRLFPCWRLVDVGSDGRSFSTTEKIAAAALPVLLLISYRHGANKFILRHRPSNHVHLRFCFRCARGVWRAQLPAIGPWLAFFPDMEAFTERLARSTASDHTARPPIARIFRCNLQGSIWPSASRPGGPSCSLYYGPGHIYRAISLR